MGYIRIDYDRENDEYYFLAPDNTLISWAWTRRWNGRLVMCIADMQGNISEIEHDSLESCAIKAQHMLIEETRDDYLLLGDIWVI